MGQTLAYQSAVAADKIVSQDGKRGAPDESHKEPGTAAPGPMPDTSKADRRSAIRFPADQSVRYRVFNRFKVEVGTGKAINISANGLLFTTQRTLSCGEQTEVALSLPAQPGNSGPQELVLTGRVVRSALGRAAIAIERYEMRTRRSDSATFFL